MSGQGFPGDSEVRNPHSCLENSKGTGAWWATVHGITKSQTLLRDGMTTITSFQFKRKLVKKNISSFSSPTALLVSKICCILYQHIFFVLNKYFNSLILTYHKFIVPYAKLILLLNLLQSYAYFFYYSQPVLSLQDMMLSTKYFLMSHIFHR